jgi:D-sedoheptulose 7-phosphate isomerase
MFAFGDASTMAGRYAQPWLAPCADGRKQVRVRQDIQRYWEKIAADLRRMPFDRLTRVAEVLLDCRARNGVIYIFGNGGSAATASHFACDLAKGTRVDGVPAFRVMPLTDNVPLLTAWANDVDYVRVFAEQLAALARPGDLALAISASGNSPNVLAAVAQARAAGVATVAWTGANGGRLSKLADIVVRAPMDCTEQVEDVHLLIAHSLCVALRERLRHEARSSHTLHPAPVAHDQLTDQWVAAGATGE